MSTLQRTTEKPVNLELKLSHEAQIQALTEPGLPDEERVRRFAKAAKFKGDELDRALTAVDRGRTAAYAVWLESRCERSLFANLPEPYEFCPAIANQHGANFEGVPKDTEIWGDWRPDRTTLEAFARVQQEHRG